MIRIFLIFIYHDVNYYSLKIYTFSEVLKLDKTVFAKHEVLSEEEAKKILEKYKVSEDELPRIKKEDAALTDMTCKVGSIIKITRKSITADKAVYYRVVVD